MSSPINWHIEFARIINCAGCSVTIDHNLLRDSDENIPQPGYIGTNYDTTRVLLVGQNPGTPKSLAEKDRPYTAALRALRDEPTPTRYLRLTEVLDKFIPEWPVHGKYFPLSECGLSLQDIAYCNIVRCRTRGDKALNIKMTEKCANNHFSRWLRILSPRVVVFIGKWASARGASTISATNIPHTFINRQRSLSTAERVANRAAVVSLVRQYCG